MARGKANDVRSRTLRLLKEAGVSGIKQKEIENTLGISKSYCSEVISRFVREGVVVRKGEIGTSAIIFLRDYFPGKLKGSYRAGLLKSSEYVPAMSFLLQYAESVGSNMIFRFYDGTTGLLDDLRSGALEFALAPTNSLILSALLSVELRICSGLSSGGSGIVFRKSWRKDALLSTEVSSMISMSLRATDVEMPETIESFADPETGLKMFKKDRYRAIAIWEPYFSMIRGSTQIEKVLDYEKILDGFPCCSLATTRSFWVQNGEFFQGEMQRFMKNELTGLEEEKWLKEAVSIVAEALNLDPSFVEASLNSYNFGDKKISRSQLSNLGISLSKRQEEEIFASGLLV